MKFDIFEIQKILDNSEFTELDALNKILKWEEIPNYGDIYSLKDFIELVEDKAFIPYDGFGQLSNGIQMVNFNIWRFLRRIELPFEPFFIVEMEECFKPFVEQHNLTEVVWFNR